ncbi:MAG: hypothetical protein CMH52_11865 [Myxococcales bacterium]|nr:hypothetical protein [Myxococcales bacterium]|tara:strand:+ start:393 stop:971 length:579 start_codon:yes stop_codon:yes gene_type:complete
MNTSTSFYIGLVLVVAIQRLLELRLSKHNTQRLLDQGAIEVGSGHYPVMASLHTIWLFACVGEAVWRDQTPPVVLVVTGLTLLTAGQALRLIAIKTLGPRWTTRIIVLPHARVVNEGIFRFIRHPNYLGVVLEIAALPLIFGGWVTAVMFSIANAWLLLVRIRTEETELSRLNNYEATFEDKNRFLPIGRTS